MIYEDAQQLDRTIDLEPVLRERRREWRMLAPIEPTLRPLVFEPVRIAELVEVSEDPDEGERILGWVERKRHSIVTILYQGFVTGRALGGGQGIRHVYSAEEAFERAKGDVEEALAQ